MVVQVLVFQGVGKDRLPPSGHIVAGGKRWTWEIQFIDGADSVLDVVSKRRLTAQ